MKALEIVIATSNLHKIKEYQYLLKDYNVKLYSLNDLSLSLDVNEFGKTFEENAILKAQAISKLTDKIVLADDSGLEIDALNGFPGIHSSRFLDGYAQIEKNKAILTLMQFHSHRYARFMCSIALANCPKGKILTFNGMESGTISYFPSGNNGFGYDSIFISSTFNKSFADLNEQEKNEVSHRSRAIRKLVAYLKNLG